MKHFYLQDVFVAITAASLFTNSHSHNDTMSTDSSWCYAGFFRCYAGFVSLR